MKLCIINGPNLNLLGKREPAIYGSTTFQDFFRNLKTQYPDHRLTYYQSNSEGEIVSKLQEVGFESDGIILNAGAYTHTSVAIADAVAAISSPVIEVHISNVYSRERFRHHSYLSAVARGCIIGLGLNGYQLAVNYFLQNQ